MTEFIERSCPCCGSLEVKSKIESCVKAEKLLMKILKNIGWDFLRNHLSLLTNAAPIAGYFIIKYFFPVKN